MIAPFLSVGGSALGTVAWQAIKQLQPGEFLRELLSGPESTPSSSSSPATETASSDDKQSGAAQAWLTLAARLRERFKAAGIDLSQPIVLKEDGQGGIVVDGEHDDRAAIEQLLSSDPQLRTEFLAAAAVSTRQRDELASLLDSSLGEFRLRIEEHTASVFFD